MGGTHDRAGRVRLAAGLALVMGLLAACQGPPSAATPLPTPWPVHWDERAAIALIRADWLVEPLPDPEFAAPVPRCTVFGDRRARWVEPPGEEEAAQGAVGRLLESPVDGARLDSLAQLVAASGFFGLEPLYGPDTGPLRELTIRLEGLGEHTVRVSDSVAAPEAFEALYGLCESLRRPDEAQEVIPTGGWIYAFPQRTPGEFHTAWPDDAPDLQSFVDQPRWLDGEAVSQVWIAGRDHGARATFASGGEVFRVVVRVPGISPDTPRRPRDLQEPLPPSSPWSTDPMARIFFARFTGGLPTPHRHIGANAVDACTIFGDGRVIVSEQPIGEVRVGHLSARQLTGFMTGWINTGFFDPAPTPDPRQAPPADIIVQEVTITLNDGREATRIYPLNTSYASNARNPCATLTAFAPFVPEEGQLWAEEVGPVTRFEDDTTYALVPWPGDYVSLEDLVSPLWVGEEAVEEGEETPEAALETLRFAWGHIHGGQSRPTVLFYQRDLAYAVYVAVPNVTVVYAPRSTVPVPPTITPSMDGSSMEEPAAEPGEATTAEPAADMTAEPTEGAGG